ncbi:hypothetical protein ACWGF3_13375 [Streptomyces xanthophaeus]
MHDRIQKLEGMRTRVEASESRLVTHLVEQLSMADSEDVAASLQRLRNEFEAFTAHARVTAMAHRAGLQDPELLALAAEQDSPAAMANITNAFNSLFERIGPPPECLVKTAGAGEGGEPK